MFKAVIATLAIVVVAYFAVGTEANAAKQIQSRTATIDSIVDAAAK